MPYIQVKGDKIVSVGNIRVNTDDIEVDTYDTNSYKYKDGTWSKDTMYVPPKQTVVVINSGGK